MPDYFDSQAGNAGAASNDASSDADTHRDFPAHGKSHPSSAETSSSHGGKPRGKPFPRGNPPGPGRPKGRRNNATIRLQGMLAEAGPALLSKCMLRCRDGDPVAMKLLIPMLPIHHHRIPITLPEILTADDVTAYLNAVVRALRLGKISIAEAQSLMGMADTIRAAIETQMMARAIDDAKRPADAQCALEPTTDGPASGASHEE